MLNLSLSWCVYKYFFCLIFTAASSNFKCSGAPYLCTKYYILHPACYRYGFCGLYITLNLHLLVYSCVAIFDRNDFALDFNLSLANFPTILLNLNIQSPLYRRSVGSISDLIPILVVSKRVYLDSCVPM